MIKKVLIAASPFIIIAVAMLCSTQDVNTTHIIVIISFVIAVILNLINFVKK